ncbi:MAG TPA: tetratricopeptide repeat protein [Kofleriaceae bacterium]|jgi:tetratricopeptide (TPR) repeat protein|nr:tetratricopeptide repeat protein [Kofleriaceae bacterium]
MRTTAIILTTAILCAPVAGRAEPHAATVPAKARALADRGRAFHDAGDYDSAIAAFTQAYAIAPSPALLFNLAQSYRLQGNCDSAALMYRRYLTSSATPEGRALAETHLANVERCLRRTTLHIPAQPAPGSLVVPASPDVLATPATAPSRTAQREKDVGIGLVLGGGVALAVATYYAVTAHDAQDGVEAAYTKGAKWKDIAPLDARGKAAATIAKVAGAGGALGIASGIALYMIGTYTTRTPPTPMMIGLRGHGVEVSMLWSF